MHPYVYQMTIEAQEIDKQRALTNQRWLRDLPKRPSWIQTLRRILTVQLMRVLRLFGRAAKMKRAEYPAALEQGRQHVPSPR